MADRRPWSAGLSAARWLAAADRATLAAAWWTFRSVHKLRRDLAAKGAAARVGDPPPLPRSAGRGVAAVLTRMKPSCLEEALVMQRWMAAHGDNREVVIGVARTDRITAHAWVDGNDTRSPVTYDELYRLPAL